MNKLIFSAIVLFLMGCRSSNKMPDIETTIYKAYNENGKVIYSSSCHSFCDTDSSSKIIKYFSSSGKLLIVEELLKKDKNIFYINYSGVDEYYKSRAGMYFFGEYFNNSPFANGNIKLELQKLFFKDSSKFHLVVNDFLNLTYGINADSLEIRNLLYYVNN